MCGCRDKTINRYSFWTPSLIAKDVLKYVRRCACFLWGGRGGNGETVMPYLLLKAGMRYLKNGGDISCPGRHI